MKTHYAVHIIWSQEDRAYLDSSPELAGCIADGQSPAEALSNLDVIIEEWLATAKEEGRSIPDPMTSVDLENERKKFQVWLNGKIEAGVQETVSRIIGQMANQSHRSTFHLRCSANDLALLG
jgi:predicted RNase H-like HicB family nuclease